MKQRFSLLVLFSFLALAVMSQDTLMSYRLNLVQHPVTKRYGYAYKEQNVRSPIHGISASAVNLIGSGGSALISKKDAEYIDWAVPAQYEDADKKFRENVAMVKVGGKVGFIDLHNRFVIVPTYDGDTDLDGFHEGLAAVKRDGKWGYIDKAGRVAIAFDYEEADNFDEDFIAAVKRDGKWGAISIDGKMVVEPESKTKAMMKTLPTSNKKWREAKKLVQEQKANGSFDAVTAKLRQTAADVNTKIARTAHETLKYTQIGGADSLGIKDQYGRIIIPQGYSSITHDAATDAFVVKRGGKYGLFTYNGGRVIGTCFESMASSNKGRFAVTACGASGWIDAIGNLSPGLLSQINANGIAAEKKSKMDAVKCYNTALEINPECVAAYNNLALLDFENKDYNKGMRKLKLAAKLDPNDTIVAKNLEWAKQERKERRSERWSTGFQIASAIITLGTTAYTTYSAVTGKGASSGTSYAGTSGYDDTVSGTSGSSGSSSRSSGNSASGKCKYCAGSGTCSASSYVSRKNACNGSGLCGYCDGAGWNGMGSSQHICTACNGTKKCKTCGGTGKCKHCHGTGRA